MEDLAAGDPSHIGPFRLLGRLGAGGMGRVYLARSAGGRTVAVKLVREEYAHRREFRARFAREVAAARRVGGEWTAHVLDADMEAEIPWVATAYVAGPSLHDVVGRDFGPLPEPSLLVLANRLALALHAIHGAGLVHRDLKPSNILLAVDGPRVIDFGISRALDAVAQSALTATGAVIGSPGFMSPEQVRGERVTEASDVFCLGAVLAYAATGRVPFGVPDVGHAALMFRIAHDEPDLAGVPGALLPLVRACLHKDADRRPAPGLIATRTEAELPAHGWLPAGLLAQLARRSAQLLDADTPRTVVRPPAYRPPVPERPPNLRHEPPTGYPTGQARPAGRSWGARPAPRRRRRLAVAALVLIALAALGWFVVRPLIGHVLDGDSDSASPSPSLGSPTFDFTGVWEGSSSGSAIRMAVAGDQPRDGVVIDILDDTRMCGGGTNVLSRKGPVLKLSAFSSSAHEIQSPGKSLGGRGGCELIEEQSLEAEPDGTVLWSAGSQYTAMLKRAEHPDSAVPSGFLGRWTRTRGAPDADSLFVTVTQGALGKALVRVDGTTGGRSCTWRAVLFRVRDETRLDVAPLQLDRGRSSGACADGTPRTYRLQDGTLWQEPSGDEKQYVAFARTT
ncbi:serine/threonine-protein kinase [Streptomyces sp. BPTC-684]|uniref:serine/threonine-protein kinase n=1 Tax=Streptomyces sp. BPTC-684 TaxID=3043734 RepID=UPI0024B23B97|nr:serine/threonine-protein kinase [Streptomyces sp. BPTC-684]WHM37954.1 serine/threonine-protein kinase [Streptomyces sp. BPTC-684]